MCECLLVGRRTIDLIDLRLSIRLCSVWPLKQLCAARGPSFWDPPTLLTWVSISCRTGSWTAEPQKKHVNHSLILSLFHIFLMRSSDVRMPGYEKLLEWGLLVFEVLTDTDTEWSSYSSCSTTTTTTTHFIKKHLSWHVKNDSRKIQMQKGNT